MVPDLGSSDAHAYGQQRIDGLNTTFRDIEFHGLWSVGRLFLNLLQVVWFLLALPFRLVFRLIAWLGRIIALLLGFSFMVVGMALWAGPFFWIGVPLFVTGLVLTLHCLD